MAHLGLNVLLSRAFLRHKLINLGKVSKKNLKKLVEFSTKRGKSG